jgi:CSLREA domain-containing protein
MNGKRSAVFAGVLSCVSCGTVSVVDETSATLVRQSNNTYLVSAQVTPAGASDVHLHAVTSQGMFTMSPASPFWTGQILAYACDQTLSYKYQVDFLDSSNNRTTMVFPSFGQYEHAIALGSPPPICAGARGTTFRVNSTDDAPDLDSSDGVCLASGQRCTLRAAIMQANASDDENMILVPPGTYQLTIHPLPNADSSLSPESGDLDIAHSVTIQGTGAGVIIDGGMLDRIFDIQGSPDTVFVLIDGVTLTHGRSQGAGGAIRNAAGLRVTNATFTGNVTNNPGGDAGGVNAPGRGGAIANLGKLDVERCTFTQNNNLPDGFGGAIYTGGGANTFVNQSILYRNGMEGRAGTGGGTRGGGAICNVGSTTITNSTLSQNGANVSGSAFLNGGGTSLLHYLTVTANYAAYQGGAVSNFQGSVIMIGSLLLDNEQSPDCDGQIASGGSNVIKTPMGCHIVGAATDHIGNMPRLALPDLAQNGSSPSGGPGLSHALSTILSVQAIDTGPTITGPTLLDCPPVDQRGYPRPVSGLPNSQGPAKCDAGAVERQLFDPL